MLMMRGKSLLMGELLDDPLNDAPSEESSRLNYGMNQDGRPYPRALTPTRAPPKNSPTTQGDLRSKPLPDYPPFLSIKGNQTKPIPPTDFSKHLPPEDREVQGVDKTPCTFHEEIERFHIDLGVTEKPGDLNRNKILSRTLGGSECAVCEEPFERMLHGERIMQTSCGHISHEACFCDYTIHLESQYCPTCNAPLELDKGANILDIGESFEVGAFIIPEC
jgi:hypothetical protein